MAALQAWFGLQYLSFPQMMGRCKMGKQNVGYRRQRATRHDRDAYFSISIERI